MSQAVKAADYEKAGLFRRLIAMFYDALLLLSVLLLATALAMLITRGTLHYHNPFFRTYLFMIWFMFFAWFWTHGGQTLGMRAWKLRVQRLDGGPITLWQALLRFLTAIPSLALGGLGFLWLLADRDRMTVYDRISESVIVRLPDQQLSQQG
ncbi:MAG: RDD family protein [Gammaproteobacteria bacterium]|jgi:uncharacterized RDD family membrane protein YckC